MKLGWGYFAKMVMKECDKIRCREWKLEYQVMHAPGVHHQIKHSVLVNIRHQHEGARDISVTRLFSINNYTL